MYGLCFRGFCNVLLCVCVGFLMCCCVCMCGFYNVWFVMCGYVYVLVF